MLIIISGCTGTRLAEPLVTLSMESTIGGFQLQAPAGWSCHPIQGIDGFVGNIITSAKDTLHFNLGQFAPTLANPFYRNKQEADADDDPNMQADIKQIAGYSASVVTHRRKSWSLSGIHFDSLWTLPGNDPWRSKMTFTIYGFNLSSSARKQLLQTVASIRFVRK